MLSDYINHTALNVECDKITVASMVWWCQLGLAPTYLIDLWRPVSSTLRSCSQSCSPYHADPAWSVEAPTVWNGLPLALCLLFRTLSDIFYNQLKTVLFDRAGVGGHLW